MTEPNSTRAQDWKRFGLSWTVLGNSLLLILHTGKNIIVEEARRWGIELRPSKW